MGSGGLSTDEDALEAALKIVGRLAEATATAARWRETDCSASGGAADDGPEARGPPPWFLALERGERRRRVVELVVELRQLVNESSESYRELVDEA